jgi:predicted lipoprotein with Yx(FWY)xxD motif
MRPPYVGIAATCLTALVLAGCGGGRSRSAAGAGTGVAETTVAHHTMPHRDPPKPAVHTAHSAYGQILSDVRGFALYRFTKDPVGTTTCYGACAKAWPPYIVRSRPASRGPRGGSIGTVRRGDGRLQVTYNGQPLYFYVGDRHPGQVLCQGAVEYGGTWLVLPAA